MSARKLQNLIAQELQHSSYIHRGPLANTGRVPPICGTDDIALRREVEHHASCIMHCNRSRIINHHNSKPNDHLNGEMEQAGKKRPTQL